MVFGMPIVSERQVSRSSPAVLEYDTNRQSTAVCLQGPRKRQVISISRQGKGALGAYLFRHHPTGSTRSRCAIFFKRVQQMRGVSIASPSFGYRLDLLPRCAAAETNNRGYIPLPQSMIAGRAATWRTWGRAACDLWPMGSNHFSTPVLKRGQNRNVSLRPMW